jgi:hypothetical protein
MDGLSLESRRQLNLFIRQYLQLQTPIMYPDPNNLRQEVFQQALYEKIFKEGAISHEPPKRYQLRILKELTARIESSITDWDREVCNFVFFGFRPS